VIEGGTWEHRKRAKEMLATANQALALTTAGGDGPPKPGGRRLQDYLPKEELDRFLNNASAFASGQGGGGGGGGGGGADAAGGAGAYAANKLDASNVGFQMLKQAGWQENTGLGKAPAGGGGGPSGGGGIVNPIAAGGGNQTGAGVGVAAGTEQPATGDDAFDQFRKRNMLAYRFRPNPLNNPRRAYY
jgi:splicing factor 4